MPVAGAEIELFEGGSGAPLLYLHSAQGVTAGTRSSACLAKHARDRAVASGLRHVEPAGLARQRRRHRPHLSRADGQARARQGRHDRLLDRRLDRRRNRHQGAGADRPAGDGRPGRRQDRHARQARHSRHVRACRRTSSPSCCSTIRTKYRPDLAAMSDEQIAIMARNRETLALIAWEPYMHNPKLKHRLHRVDRAGAVRARRQRRAGLGGISASATPSCCRMRGSTRSPKPAMRRSSSSPQALRRQGAAHSSNA